MSYHDLAVEFRRIKINEIYSKENISDFELYIIRRWIDMFREDII